MDTNSADATNFHGKGCGKAGPSDGPAGHDQRLVAFLVYRKLNKQPMTLGRLGGSFDRVAARLAKISGIFHDVAVIEDHAQIVVTGGPAVCDGDLDALSGREDIRAENILFPVRYIGGGGVEFHQGEIGVVVQREDQIFG